MSGQRLNGRKVFVKSGSLETTSPFYVQVDSTPLRTIAPEGTIFLAEDGCEVSGVISSSNPDEWGPEAQIFLRVGNITTDVVQRIEGPATINRL